MLCCCACCRVCVAMSSCGACFPLLLPGSLDLQQLLGCCLLLLGPACSGAALSANWEGQESRQVCAISIMRLCSQYRHQEAHFG